MDCPYLMTDPENLTRSGQTQSSSTLKLWQPFLNCQISLGGWFKFIHPPSKFHNTKEDVPLDVTQIFAQSPLPMVVYVETDDKVILEALRLGSSFDISKDYVERTFLSRSSSTKK